MAQVNKYKSKFEAKIATTFRKQKIRFKYEPTRFKFIQPAIKRTYTPDFYVSGNGSSDNVDGMSNFGVYVETKGKLTSEERKKLLWWKESNPGVPFIILFMRGRNPIRKGSKTSYLDWARKHGFEAYEWEKGIEYLKTKTKKKKENNSS